MKTKLFFLSTLLLATIGLSGCSDDDEWEEYATDETEDVLRFHLNISAGTAHYSTISPEIGSLVFDKDDLLYFEMAGVYIKHTGRYNDFHFNDDFQTDTQFFKIYSEDGKQVWTPQKEKFQGLILQSSPPQYSYGYLWEDGKGHPQLPVGNYFTKFRVRYNAQPGEPTKCWRTKNFEVHFKIR
jgi:hypothetical protein